MVDIYGKLVGKYTIVPWESVMGNGSCELAKGLVAVLLLLSGKPFATTWMFRWKLGSMVRINGLFHLLINGLYIGVC